MTDLGWFALRRRPLAIVGAVFVLVMVGAIVSSGAARSAPYVPKHDGEVLERLPYRRADPDAVTLRRLRERLGAEPSNAEVRIALSRKLVDLYRARSDPRYLGRARAALGAFWTDPRPPSEARLLRATILQSNHEFLAALEDFDQLVQGAADDPQPWLARAVVRSVIGRYAEAAADCEQVRHLANALIAETCLAGPRSMSGAATEARARLLAEMAHSARLAPAEQTFALSTLAELEWHLHLDPAAAEHFEAVLAVEPNDAYTRGAYADFLLDRGQAERALALVRGFESVDALLLRQALAAHAGKNAGAAELTRELEGRFEAARLRGDHAHRREEARAALSLASDPERALALAEDNWKVQREWWDARLLLAAALAAGQKQRAEPVMSFLRAAGNDDPTLTELVGRLQGLASK